MIRWIDLSGSTLFAHSDVQFTSFNFLTIIYYWRILFGIPCTIDTLFDFRCLPHSFFFLKQKNKSSLTTKKADDKIFVYKFSENGKSRPGCIILKIQRLEGKQCRSRWGGSWWATSSISTLFANSALYVSGTWRVNSNRSGPERKKRKLKCKGNYTCTVIIMAVFYFFVYWINGFFLNIVIERFP